MRRKPIKPSPPAESALPSWLPPALIALVCVVLFGLFSAEISNSDFWWHLKTGEYILNTRSLPIPDPFAFTTSSAGSAYTGEEVTRHFNLTHEWFSQLLLYLVYRATGFAGIVACRAVLLMLFCAIVGVLACLRSGGFYRSLLASVAAAAVVAPFAVDRPFVITFLLTALTLLLLETNRRPWLLLLPLVMLIWANCHGGFIVGWGLMGIWSAEAILNRIRGKPTVGDVRLWIICAAAVLVSGLNPNGFHVVEVLANYRRSALTSRLYEWKPPDWWPPAAFSLLILVAFCALALAWRKVRPADWLLLAFAASASAAAGRNTFLAALIAPPLIAAYAPFMRKTPRWLPLTLIPVLLVCLGIEIARGQSFQFRAADWQYPARAAQFIASHRISDRMLNTYEWGGYLIWKLWPLERVFIDGRALSESLFADYAKIVENAHEPGQSSAQELLDKYGIQMIVMNGFEYIGGDLYWLASSLADPDQTKWKLVFSDSQALVFMRAPPSGVRVLDSLDALAGLEGQCEFHIQHEPQFAGCAGALAQLFSQAEDLHRERKWLGVYVDHVKDQQAMDLYQKLLAAGN